MLDHLDNTPLAERARQTLLDAILNDRFQGDRLPAEDELARMLNISRTTIRTALHSLEKDGIITRRRAIGTIINRHVGPATLGLHRLVSFTWLLEEKGHKARMETTWHRGPLPKDIGEIFGLEPGEDSYLTEKFFYADDELAIYDRDVVPWRNLHSDVAEDAPTVLFEFGQAFMKAPIDHAVAEIVPIVKRRGVSTKLKVDPSTAFLRLHQRHYSRAGKEVAYSVSDIDDTYVRFEVFRHK